ncbi:MAG TPA: hypothetical protein VGG48_18030 [Rhizomicrobium sp.]|jgi:hypothetical protein
MRALLAAFALILLAQTPASAADAPKCTDANSQTISVEELTAQPDHYTHVCVHVRALLVDRGLVSDVRSLYAESERRWSGMVAIYSSDGSDTEKFWSSRAVVDVIGEATTCGTLYDEAMAEADRQNREARNRDVETIVMMSGLCHYHRSNDAALIANRVTWFPDEPIRLSGETAWQMYGDLDVVAEVHLGAARPAAEQWFDAIRRRDPTVFQKESWSKADVDRNLDPQRSPLRALFGAQPGEIRYFRHKNREAQDASNRTTYACVCKAGDCSGKWPISVSDTGLNENWPYICVRVGPGGEIWFD